LFHDFTLQRIFSTVNYAKSLEMDQNNLRTKFLQ